MLLQKCHTCKFISSLNVKNAYWLVRLDEASQKYTGYIYRSKSYVYCNIQFKLNISLAAFLRGLYHGLDESVREFSIIFVDDILILSKTFEEHLVHIETINRRSKLYQRSKIFRI